MAKIENISAGPRGFTALSGEVLLEKGGIWEGDVSDGELASAKSTGFFQVDGDGSGSEPGPLDQSIDKLTEYLAGVNDADEVQKLLDDETAGKSRAGAISALEARRDELLA